eukprot:UC1_evm1s782
MMATDARHDAPSLRQDGGHYPRQSLPRDPFFIPNLPLDAPEAAQPHLMLLPLYGWQLRSLARMQTIESYTCDESGEIWRGAFNTFLDYAPRGGVIADATGL